MADIFISYKREDKHLAEDVIHRLKEAGFSVWYDDRITPHSSWDETIEREIAAAKAVVVLWTTRSVASEWVRTEADYAKTHGKIVPVMLEDSAVPLAYRRTQFADLTHWDGNKQDRNFEKLVGWIRGLVNGTGTGPESIGASTFGAEPPRQKKSSRLPLLALLVVLLVGGAGGLHAAGVIDLGISALGNHVADEPVDAKLPETETPTPEPIVDNKPPAASDDSGQTQSPNSVDINVIANDSDPDGDPLTITAIAGVAVSQGQSVELDDASVRLSAANTLTVTPKDGYTGILNFDYGISDGTDTAQGIVQVTVTPPPPPTCIDLIVTVADKDPNGNNWDRVAFGSSASAPDPEVTSNTHPSIGFDCEDEYVCGRRGRRNDPLQREISLMILDDDVGAATEPIGSGNCDIPSTGCQLGLATVDITAAACAN